MHNAIDAVGIIANPASGKDIRRLVAHALVFDTPAKINIIRRVLLGLNSAGIEHVFYMPDQSQMVQQAASAIELNLDIEPISGCREGSVGDTIQAARSMAALGVKVIISLGGDGTNRALVKGTRDIPLVPISSGTNNVFPSFVDGTVAGLAAAAIAQGFADVAEVAPRCKIITVDLDEEPSELALIDVGIMDGMYAGSRAIWQVDALREVILTCARPDVIGLAALGGMIGSVTPEEDNGLHVRLANSAGCDSNSSSKFLRAAIGPGLVETINIAQSSYLPFGSVVSVTGPALLAFDGERELYLKHNYSASMSIDRSGPPVVDISRCLSAARDAGFLSDAKIT